MAGQVGGESKAGNSGRTRHRRGPTPGTSQLASSYRLPRWSRAYLVALADHAAAPLQGHLLWRRRPPPPNLGRRRLQPPAGGGGGRCRDGLRLMPAVICCWMLWQISAHCLAFNNRHSGRGAPANSRRQPPGPPSAPPLQHPPGPGRAQPVLREVRQRLHLHFAAHAVGRPDPPHLDPVLVHVAGAAGRALGRRRRCRQAPPLPPAGRCCVPMDCVLMLRPAMCSALSGWTCGRVALCSGAGADRRGRNAGAHGCSLWRCLNTVLGFDSDKPYMQALCRSGRRTPGCASPVRSADRIFEPILHSTAPSARYIFTSQGDKPSTAARYQVCSLHVRPRGVWPIGQLHCTLMCARRCVNYAAARGSEAGYCRRLPLPPAACCLPALTPLLLPTAVLNWPAVDLQHRQHQRQQQQQSTVAAWQKQQQQQRRQRRAPATACCRCAWWAAAARRRSRATSTSSPTPPRPTRCPRSARCSWRACRWRCRVPPWCSSSASLAPLSALRCTAAACRRWCCTRRQSRGTS